MPVTGKKLIFSVIHGYWVIGYWEITSCIIILLLLIRDGESVGDVYQPVLYSVKPLPFQFCVHGTWLLVNWVSGYYVLFISSSEMERVFEMCISSGFSIQFLLRAKKSMQAKNCSSCQHWMHFALQWTPHRLHTACCTLLTTHCTLHAAHCTMEKTAHCTLHTEHCTLHTAHCTLHTGCLSRWQMM